MAAGQTVDPDSATPVYVQVADILRSRIEAGQLLPDRPVPSESQPQQEFGVARGTARKAIALLRDQGLVVTVKGRGSYINPADSEYEGIAGMQVIEGAGRYTAATGGEPNHWAEHMASADLSVGTYSIPAGGLDDQEPHREDEIYVVQAGAATLVTDSGTAEVGPGSVIFVPAGENHKFTDVRGDLALLVIFAPPYGSRPDVEK